MSENNNPLEPAKWVERYSDYLFSFALMRISRRDVAEDLVQETFLAAWNAREHYQSSASEKTWLTSILKNKIIDYYRKSSTKNEQNVLDNDSQDGSGNRFFESNGHWANSSSPMDWNKDLKNDVEAQEFRSILKQCLGKLPERTRAVFVMKVMDGEDSETICKELNITPSNFWILMHRAKLHLRQCMEMNWANA